MKRLTSGRTGLLTGFLVALIATGFGTVPIVHADAISDAATQRAVNYALDPPLGIAGAAPLVMINLSRDHQLFYKAYNDFTDLNGDGKLDTTYVNNPNTLPYAGYFDAKKCYTYSSDGYFTPKGAIDASGYCSASWSGNFLNWISMTRMDEVRKILYGGLRSTDDTNKTILERAFLPADAHSFAKFYNGSDIAKLTPYTVSTTQPVSSKLSPGSLVDTSSSVSASTNKAYSVAYWSLWLKGLQSQGLNIQVGDQLKIVTSDNQTILAPVSSTSGSGNNTKYELYIQRGMITSTASDGTVTTMACTGTNCSTTIDTLRKANTWTVTNLTRTGITFCNTTPQPTGNALSQSVAAAPAIRMAVGDYSLWGANEKRQCRWSGEDSNLQNGFSDGFRSNGNRAAFSGLGSSAENPTNVGGTTTAEFSARVQVCVSKALLGSENCKQYPDDKTASNPYKPIGLLQKYAETGNIKFGLVTPTFDHNSSGGVVRANLPGPGTNDGDFIKNEINASTGQFVTGTDASKGIISNINALRIYGYKYNTDDNYGSTNGCTYQQIGIGKTADADNRIVKEGNCSSWGNPMAESYIETLRYLAGKSPNTSFASGTEDTAIGMTVVGKWNDPISEANFCAALNVINFNASSLSYDTDDTDGFGDLATGKNVADWTDAIGVSEGITGKSWFVGNSAGTSVGADLCSAKNVTAFSSLKGICPEVPALKGGYLIAGAAYGAHVNPIRDLGKDSGGALIVPADDRTSLKVTTFGVQLATNTPQIRVQVPGKSGYITIIPAYRLTYPGAKGTLIGGGALVDFKVLSQTLSSDGKTAKGSFYATWEDSFAGGDYDQDMWGIISYEITGTTVKITTKPVAASTNQGQGFGYIISGTTKDGPHFHSGIYSFSYTDPTPIDVYDATGTTKLNSSSGVINTSGGCNGCTVSDAATMAKYDVGTTDANTLKDPLLYAAKWGGFRLDTTKANGADTPFNDMQPLDNSKWDSDKDGTPDNYFLVSDPGKLETSLDALFRKILAKISSGTAAATVATSANGTGVTYSALYEAERTDNNGRRATWIGALSGLWTDQTGLLREDGNQNGQLDDYNTDPVITYEYQASSQRTQATRYTSTDPNTFKPGTKTTVELSDLNYLWNARAKLWDPELNTATQRDYTKPFSDANGRYIFTWIDSNNGTVTSGDVKPFIWDATGANGFNSTNYRYLNSNDPAEAQRIISWIRGTENATLRNRTVDYGTDAALQKRVARLGDIINSTPLVVSAPAESYDLLYNDTSYASFRAAYRNRRQMIYVGANDGMLHAFNGGFYNTSCQAFTTQPNDKVCTPTDRAVNGNVTARTAHPLGGEVWAYVPKNLLPHLRWLTDPNYKHTYYVDGSPIAFDAKVWTASDDDKVHVGGWGTILVVPFRLGGGTISVDTSLTNTPAVKSFESSYVVMDVTDPESAPVLLAEIGFPGARALSTPAVAMIRDVTTGDPNRFFLALGSGPTDAKRVASSADLRVNIYDVATLVSAHTPTAVTTFDLGATDTTGQKSFAGDLIASDYNLDGKAEGIYFGSVRDAGTDTFGGEFWKVAINGEPDPKKWTAGKMLELGDGTSAGMPVTIRPTLGRNDRGVPMVFFGTGRMYTTKDKATADQQRIYGIIDPSLLTSGDAQAALTLPLSQGSLVNVTGINVYTTNAVDGVSDKDPLIPAGTDLFSALEKVFDKATVAGWYRNLATNGSNPSERVVSAQSLLGGLLLTATYVPGTSICTGLGTSYLFGLNYKTGTADPGAFMGTGGASNTLANPSTALGQGLPAPPSLHAGDTSSDRNGSKKVTACTQTSTGAIICKDVVTLDPVTSGETSWREPLGN